MFSKPNRATVSAIFGVALIVVYSIAMITTAGDADWAWLLLIAGLAAVFDAGRHRTRADD